MRYLLAVIFLSHCCTAYAQPSSIWFDKIKDEAGYSIHGVQHMIQDRDGFMWFSHADGVSKFDGYNFKLYSRSELATPTFSSKSVSLVFRDNDGNTWIVTNTGALMAYDSDLDRFRLKNDTTTVIEGNAFSFVEDHEGNFWIGSAGGGLYKINLKKKVFRNYRTVKDDVTSINNDFVTGLTIDGKRNLWIGTTNGLCRYDPTTDAFLRYPLNNTNANDTYRYRVIRDLLLSSDGYLYAGTYGGLHRIDLETMGSRHFLHDVTNPKSLSHNSIFRLQEDAERFIWIATYGGGINRFNPSTLEFNSWKATVNEPGKLHTNNFFTMYFDGQGSLWIGAADEGVFLYNPNAKKIHTIGSNSSDSTSISPGWIRSLFQENDSIIWIGFNGAGINKYNLNTEKVIKRYVNDPKDPFSLGHNAVIAIDKDNDGNLWFGLEGGGLNMLDKRSGRFTRYTFTPNQSSLSNNAVSTFLVDDELMWVTTYVSGLDLFDLPGKKFYHFREDSLKALGISFSSTENIVKHDGNIWFGTHQGIVVFDKKEKIFVKIPGTKGDIATVSGSKLELRPYSEKEILIDKDASEIIKIKYNSPSDFQQEPLWKDTVDRDETYEMRFAADKSGNLWVSSGNRLSKIDLRNNKNTFNLSNSLSVERRLTGIYTANDGKIFLTGTNGFSWFYPDEIEKDSTPVKVVLTGLEIFNKPILVEGQDSTRRDDFYIPKQIDKLEVLELSYYQNFFSIRFAALTASQRDKIQYAYKLDGFDREWVYVGNRRFASYTNLDPGTYKFNVRATNADGYWSPDAKSMMVVILPPFWRTSWFITLAIVLTGAIIYSIHRYRITRTLEVERLRSKIASDLHDEVGSNLTRISIYSDLLQNGIEVEERKSYLAGIGALSREVVGTMSDIIWSIDNRNDSFESLIIRMKDFATELLQAKNIDLEFKVSGVVGRKVLDPALKQNVYLIFKESIHNVVKHSQGRTVKVGVSNDGAEFRMVISDDGRGFHDEGVNRGNGMRNMRRRAEAINATFEVINLSGTTITLRRKPL
jgi:ligand-binding sensor domain-containing protein